MNTQNEQILAEVLDQDKVQVLCKKHNYVGSKHPPKTSGCRDCWFAYFVWDHATTPPNLRAERLDELESIIHHAVEYEEKGRFGNDLELYDPSDPRFKVEIGTE